MAGLYGMYELALAADGRLRLPPKIATKLGSELIGWVAENGAVRIASRQWLDIDRLAALREARMLLFPILVGHGRRIVVPAPARRVAQLNATESVILIGLGDTIEIWNRSRYDAFRSSGWQS